MEIDKGFEIACLDHGYVRLIDYMGSDLRILEAARISYKSPSKGEEADKKLLHYLYKNRHTSPFEQCNITFNIKMPIFVMRQFVRHRTFKLNEWSGRYSELKDEFYIPTQWRKQDSKNKQGSLNSQDFNAPNAVLPYSDGRIDSLGNSGVQLTGSLNEAFTSSFSRGCKEAYRIYEMLLAGGVAKEMARMILPVNIYTEVYVNCDLHNLMHFLRLRLDSHAQYEIRVFAEAMKYIASRLFPWTFEAYESFKFSMIKSNL